MGSSLLDVDTVSGLRYDKFCSWPCREEQVWQFMLSLNRRRVATKYKRKPGDKCFTLSHFLPHPALPFSRGVPELAKAVGCKVRIMQPITLPPAPSIQLIADDAAHITHHPAQTREVLSSSAMLISCICSAAGSCCQHTSCIQATFMHHARRIVCNADASGVISIAKP